MSVYWSKKDESVFCAMSAHDDGGQGEGDNAYAAESGTASMMEDVSESEPYGSSLGGEQEAPAEDFRLESDLSYMVPNAGSLSSKGAAGGKGQHLKSLASPPLEIPMPDGTERGQFLHDLYSFMVRIGQPIVKTPYLGYQELDLYKLYQIVIKRGGMDEVTRKQAWKAVYQELGIPTMSTSASYNTRTNYKKHLYLYELEHCNFNERRPPGKDPLFEIGEYIRIVSSNFEGRVFYARIVKCRWGNGRNNYYVHYNGWSNSHDEWMPETVLSKLLPEETQYPQRLVNPQPTRSSKSNNIIGEPLPPQQIAKAEVKPPKQYRRKPSTSGRKPRLSEDGGSEGETSNGCLDEYKEGSFVTKSLGSSDGGRRNRSSPDEGGRKLRLKLRHRPDTTLSGHPPAADSSGVSGATGPTLTLLQAEMDKLEAEKLLEYVPPKKPKILSEGNLHSYNRFKSVGRLSDKAFKSIDLRVPNLGDLVGRPPYARDDMRPESSRLFGKGDLKTGSSEVPPIRVESTESIAALEKELKAIKKEYHQKKHMLKLYYGPSSNSSDSASSPNPSSAQPLVEIGGRRRRGRA